MTGFSEVQLHAEIPCSCCLWPARISLIPLSEVRAALQEEQHHTKNRGAYGYLGDTTRTWAVLQAFALNCPQKILSKQLTFIMRKPSTVGNQ